MVARFLLAGRSIPRRTRHVPDGHRECSRSVKRATRAQPPDHRSKWHMRPGWGAGTARKRKARQIPFAPAGAHVRVGTVIRWFRPPPAGFTHRLHSLQPSGLAAEDLAVHAAVRAFLLLHRPRADEAERSPLELVFVLRGECARAGIATSSDHDAATARQSHRRVNIRAR